MKSLKLIMLAVLVLTVAGIGQAATIALVSDAYAPTDPTVDMPHEDDSFVAWLQGLGHTVLTDGMGEAFNEGNDPFNNPAKLAVLQSADLVIVSRRTNSGAYDGQKQAWNALSTPVMLTGGYITRDTRWGWSTGGSGDAATATTNLDGGGAAMFDWSTAPSTPDAPKAVYLPDAAAEVEAQGGTVVETFDGRPFLVTWDAGTDLDGGGALNYGVLGGDRVMIGHWGYDDGIAGVNGPGGVPAGWGDYITDDYKNLLASTITTTIPEPATLALLGLGGFLLRRRR